MLAFNSSSLGGSPLVARQASDWRYGRAVATPLICTFLVGATDFRRFNAYAPFVLDACGASCWVFVRLARPQADYGSPQYLAPAARGRWCPVVLIATAVVYSIPVVRW